MDVLQRVLWIAACIALPVVWGVLVHGAFEKLRSRPRDDDDPVFTDFQI